MNKQKILHAASWTAVLLFFFVGPLAGAAYFWNDAHNKIRARAVAYVRETALPLFKDWSPDRIFDEYSIDGRGSFDKAQLAAFRAKLGSITKPGDPIPQRSYAKERDDNVWQFVVVESDCGFEKGKAKLRFLIVHKTTSTIWQIEKLEVEPLR